MSLKLKISLAMGFLIVVLTIVGLSASLLTTRLANMFAEYRATAQNDRVFHAVLKDLLEARLAAMKFRSGGGADDITEFRGNVGEIVVAQEELNAIASTYDFGSELPQLGVLVGAYFDGFLAATEQQAVNDEAFSVVAGSGTAARAELSAVLEAAHQFGNDEAAYHAGRAVTEVLLARLYFERFLVGNEQASLDRARESMGAAEDEMNLLLRDLSPGALRDRAEGAVSEFANFRSKAAEVADAIFARNANYAEMDSVGPQFNAIIEDVIDANYERPNVLGPEGPALAANTIRIVSVIAVVGFILGSLLAFTLTRAISRPINGMTQAMSQMADGDLETEIIGLDDKHEIGRMAKALEVFRDNTLQAKELAAETERVREKAEEERRAQEEKERRDLEAQHAAEAEQAAVAAERLAEFERFQAEMQEAVRRASSGDFSQQMVAEFRDDELNTLASLMNRLNSDLQSSFAEVLSHMSLLSSGHLDIQIVGDRQGAFRELQDSFNDTVKSLTETVARISEGSGSVADNAKALQASSSDMARRAEGTSASVEETATAVEEISASIKNVVDNAEKATSSTQQVESSARKGREVAEGTKHAMEDMTRASEQIERVIGMIEEIAFQINLLALNAGVEAARAGDAGRGFSVVASEVRALAQRSQEAVQEINAVIEENGRSVQKSVEHVKLSEDALEQIMSEVGVASAQISEIAAAVSEQSVSINEINRAIQTIDTSIQSDASSIEELNALSHVLASDADGLNQAVSVFKTHQTEQMEDRLSA